MANKLIVREARGYAWGKITVRISWAGGGFSEVWINESGIGEFTGTGTIDTITAYGETLPPDPSKVYGDTTVMAKSSRNH